MIGICKVDTKFGDKHQIWCRGKKVDIYLQDNYPHDPGGRDIYKYQVKEYLENLYMKLNILFNDNFPTDLHTAFQIIKLLIEKGNLNSIHKNSYQHFNCL